MIDKSSIMKYVKHTPINTNPAIVGNLVDQFEEDNMKLYEHRIRCNDGLSPSYVFSIYSGNSVPFTKQTLLQFITDNGYDLSNKKYYNVWGVTDDLLSETTREIITAIYRNDLLTLGLESNNITKTGGMQTTILSEHFTLSDRVTKII